MRQGSLTQKQRKQITEAVDRVKNTNARSHQVSKLEAKLQEAYALLDESYKVLVALAKAETTRDYYIINMKDHAKPASGLSITDIVRNAQAEKIHAFLEGK